MYKGRFLFLALSGVASFGILFATTPTVQAKTLVGVTCKKIGTTMGDGPGRSVICKKKGAKNVWQVLQEKIPNQPQVSNSPSPSTQPSSNSPSPSTQPSSSSPSPSTQPSSSSPSPSTQPSSNCQKLPEFTSDFIDPQYVRVVTPIGEQTGSGGVIAVRSYVHPSSQYIGKELPIFAPVDMVLNQASYYKPPGSSATYEPEYSLYFDAGCGISVKFFHIKGVVGKVASVVPANASSSSAGQPVKSTPIKAGEQIGWYKLGDNSVAFDFWVDDEARTNDFIVATHFASSNALHSVCPYNFFTQTKKAIWLSKLGAPGSDPIPGTQCGVVTQGLAGTADGMWFISPDTLTDHLTYDGAYQSQIMFTTDPSGIIRIGGLNASSSLNQMMVSPQSTTYRKPIDVKIGDTQCWSTANQSVSVNVLSNTTMTVVVGVGSCTALPNASTGKTYHR